eukprot:s2297_g1.t3
MEKETSMLVKEVEAMKPSPTSSGTSSSMHVAVESFLKSMIHSLRVGQALVHPSLTSVCHLIYAAAEVKFGILAAQNAVGTLLVSRVITPSLLRVQRPADGNGASERVSELSRLLQRIAHFAHHDDEARGQTLPDLNQVVKHVASLRELVSRVLSLPPDSQMGLPASTEESEAAALWTVQTCCRWTAGVPSDVHATGDPPGRARQQQQLVLAAQPIARLGEPLNAWDAMPSSTAPSAPGHRVHERVPEGTFRRTILTSREDLARLIGEVLGMDVFEVEYKETAEGDLVDYKAKFLLDSGWRASRLNVVHPLHKYEASESWR